MSYLLLWIVLAVFYLLALWAIFLLWRLKRTTLENGVPFVDPERRIFLRYPPWWDLETKGTEFLFRSPEKDGVLLLQLKNKTDVKKTPNEWIHEFAQQQKIVWDNSEIEVCNINNLQGAHLESRALVGLEERRFFQVWVFKDEKTAALLVYQSSVMFGMVDAFYLNQMIKTIQMPAPPK